MEVFYINIENFKKHYDKTFLTNFTDIEIKNEKRFYEYTIGRFLIKTIAEKYYKIKNPEICLNNKQKPFLKNSDLHFNLSHSKDIVIACFDDKPCGIDIEYMKKRNLKIFSKYYNQHFETQEDFYKFWTQQEAIFKLDDNVSEKFSKIFQDNYYLTIVSTQKFKNNLTFNSFDLLLI